MNIGIYLGTDLNKWCRLDQPATAVIRSDLTAQYRSVLGKANGRIYQIQRVQGKMTYQIYYVAVKIRILSLRKVREQIYWK